MQDYLKEFNKLTSIFQFRVDRSRLLSDIFSMMACSISATVDKTTANKREAEYQAIINGYNEKERLEIARIAGFLFDLLTDMSEPNGVFDDYLGSIYMNSGTQAKSAGQFFTPYHVSELSAAISVGEAQHDEHGIITIDEPACGSGGMLLAAVDHLRKRGVNYAEEVFCHAADLDGRCVRMAYIQLSLAGIPAIIHKRDTLCMKTFETWTTPACVFNWIKFGRYRRC